MTKLTDPKTIAALAYKAANVTGKVMVVDNRGHRRHLKLHTDGPHDVYVRTGKRGQNLTRLVEARICCREPLVIEFKEGAR